MDISRGFATAVLSRTPGGSQRAMHPGRGAGKVRVQVFPAPLPGCGIIRGLYRGLARKHPWPTPGYYPPTPSGVGNTPRPETRKTLKTFFRTMAVPLWFSALLCVLCGTIRLFHERHFP